MPFPSRRRTAVSLVVAGLLTAAGMLATPWESEATTRAYLEAYVGNETQGEIAAVLLHFGYLAFVPAVFGLLALLAPHGGRLRAIGGVLAVIGWASLPGLLAVDFYAMALVDELPIEQAVAIEEAAAGSAGAAILGITAAIPAFLGLFLLLLSAARNRVVSAAVPALFLLGVVVSFVGGGLGPAMIGGSAVLLAAMVLAARAIVAPTPPAAPVARPVETLSPATA